MVAPPFAVFEGWARRALPPIAGGTNRQFDSLLPPLGLAAATSLAFVRSPIPGYFRYTYKSGSYSISIAPAQAPDLASLDCHVCSAASPRACARSTPRNRKTVVARHALRPLFPIGSSV